MNVIATSDAPARQRSGLAVALCFAPAINEVVHLTAGPLGLFFGAFLGRRVADFRGRRNADRGAVMFLPRSDDLAT